jgi:hypothetical protein
VFFFFFFEKLFNLILQNHVCRQFIARSSPKDRGRHCTSKARIANRLVIPKRNIVRTDVLVAHLDVINDIIETYNWGCFYNSACIMLTRLVRDFYTHLEVVQDEDNGIFRQSTVEGHVIQQDYWCTCTSYFCQPI